ncbi:HEPN domain-containing protein [Actinocorallia longicatena]|uniref:RiboL-PSP-HEPN domain-containing protein n=1 Tax=Actinocorallia longicatena TaxID=111803 RepID=A0ABP6QD30_9ACTN
MILQYAELAVNLEKIRRFLSVGSEERQTADQRRFAYIGCISALYASFENFAERVALRFGEMLLADAPRLPAEQMANLRRRYIRNASLLLNQNLGSGRYREITELDVAKSLASCLDESSPSFDLKLELIALHNSNLRWDSLCELFQWAVPDLQSKIYRSDAIANWNDCTGNPTQGGLASALKSELEDLVERRNEVSHRAIPEEIQSYERLIAKVDFIEAVALGLVASLAETILNRSIDDGETVSLGVPSEYFRGNRIVVINSLGSPVSEGDCVLLGGGHSMRWGRIQEIRLEDSRVSRATAGVEAGLCLDFEARRGSDLLLWRNPNPDLAFPPDRIFGRHGPLGDIIQ